MELSTIIVYLAGYLALFAGAVKYDQYKKIQEELNIIKSFIGNDNYQWLIQLKRFQNERKTQISN